MAGSSSEAQAKTTADAAFLAAYNSGQSHPAVFKILGRVTKHQLYRWDRALKEAGGDYRALCDHRGWAQAQGAQGRISPEAQKIMTKSTCSLAALAPATTTP